MGSLCAVTFTLGLKRRLVWPGVPCALQRAGGWWLQLLVTWRSLAPLGTPSMFGYLVEVWFLMEHNYKRWKTHWPERRSVAKAHGVRSGSHCCPTVRCMKVGKQEDEARVAHDHRSRAEHDRKLRVTGEVRLNMAVCKHATTTSNRVKSLSLNWTVAMSMEKASSDSHVCSHFLPWASGGQRRKKSKKKPWK